jgi:hypothetical protein
MRSLTENGGQVRGDRRPAKPLARPPAHHTTRSYGVRAIHDGRAAGPFEPRDRRAASVVLPVVLRPFLC